MSEKRIYRKDMIGEALAKSIRNRIITLENLGTVKGWEKEESITEVNAIAESLGITHEPLKRFDLQKFQTLKHKCINKCIEDLKTIREAQLSSAANVRKQTDRGDYEVLEEEDAAAN